MGYRPRTDIPQLGQLLQTGEEVFPRGQINSSGVTSTTGNLRLSFFTCRRTELVSTLTAETGGTLQTLATVCRMGLWPVDAVGNLLAPIVTTPNDTTLFIAGSTVYSKAVSVAATKVAGRRYAFGVLIVTGGNTPTFCGISGFGSSSILGGLYVPRLAGFVTGLADLPSTVALASIADTNNLVWGAMT